MLNKMQFLPELRQFLLERGEIYTVRKYRMDSADVWVEGVGVCKRLFLGRVCKCDLIRYVRLSGFPALEDWWQMIQRLTRGSSELYLYHVVREEKNGQEILHRVR